MSDAEACARTGADKPANLTYAVGNNWIVFPELAATARSIAASLPAILGVVRCAK